MNKQEFIELAKKYNCKAEFGDQYYCFHKVKDGGTKFTNIIRVSVEDFLRGNQNKTIYVYTLKDDNILWGDNINDGLNNHHGPPYRWLRAVAYDCPGNIAKKLLNEGITVDRTRGFGEIDDERKELTDFQKEAIDYFLNEETETDLLILNRKNPDVVGHKTFKQQAEDEFNATEFWLAMQYLDDIGIPREDDDGQTYSIVGRIKYLKNNKDEN